MHPFQSPSTDPGSASSGGDEICRKYIWGTCNKYAQCKYRHELDIEKMKDILRFCHDYQNRNGCTRENCKFLHATKEEQNFFLTTGQLPPVLAERHAVLAATETNMQSNGETIPQIAMFISESYMSQPPPAPWPPLPPPQGVVPPAANAPPPPPSASPPRHAPALQQAQQPPPPAPTPTSTATPLQAPFLFTMNPPPPIVPPKFDASRPPPPIPSHIQSTQLKRKIDSNGNAGSSKLRKPDGSEVSEGQCENCAQRELRIEGYKQQMEALNNEEETQILLYKNKLQEYEIGKDILKTIVGPQLFAALDGLIEGSQTPQVDNSGSFISAFLQLFQMCLGGGARNVIEPVPSTAKMYETLQSLTSRSSRQNVTQTNSGPDLLKWVVETLRNSSAPDRPPTAAERPTEPSDMNRMSSRANGFMANGQKAATGVGEPRFAYPGGGRGAAGPALGARVPAAMPSYSAAGPSGYGAPAPPPAAYPVYHPAVPPPPNRPYYAQGHGPHGPGSSNVGFNGERATGPGSFQGIQPPPAAATPRPNQNASNYNPMGWYPQPPYFPRY